MRKLFSALLVSALVCGGILFTACDSGSSGIYYPVNYKQKVINPNSTVAATSLNLFAASDISEGVAEGIVSVSVSPADAQVKVFCDTDLIEFTGEPQKVAETWAVKFKPKKPGTFVITAQSGLLVKTFTITVNSKIVSVDVTGGDSPIDKGATVQLSAKINPASAKASVKWASSDTNVATVDENGLVTAVNSGVATITATATDSEKASLGRGNVVTGFKDVTVKGFFLSDTFFVLCQKDLYDDVEAKTVGIDGGTVVWTSSDTNYFTVAADPNDSKKAKLTYKNGALGAGEVTATLTTASGTYTAKGTVIVVPYTMLALGDSIAAGYAPKPMGGDAGDDVMKEQDMIEAYEKYLNRRKGGTDPNYVNEFCYSAKLKDYLATGENIRLFSYANTGDQTKDLIAKLAPDYSDGTIATKKGEILEAVSQADYITLCIGANDILQRATGWNILAQDLDWFRKTFTEDLKTFKTNFDTILDKIFAAGPYTKVYVMSVYSPYHLFNQTNIPAAQFNPPWGSVTTKVMDVNGIAEEFLAQLNAYIKSKADANASVYYVDVATEINGVTDVAEHSKLINADPSKLNLTALISKGGAVIPIWFDPHPTKDGAVKIAEKYNEVLR